LEQESNITIDGYCNRLLQEMLAHQNDRHQGTESRPFEDLPHDPHGRMLLLMFF